MITGVSLKLIEKKSVFQIIVAKPHAKFMGLWLQTYQDYRPSMWYYNAGEVPTKNILEKYPKLVTRIPEKFGVHNLVKELYTEKSAWDEWKSYYAIHLLSRHRDYLAPVDVQTSKILEFNEHNIQNYSSTFGKIKLDFHFAFQRSLFEQKRDL